MERDTPPRNADKKRNDNQREMNTGREGGDDSLTNASPTDDRADEKVIVNEQREDQVVNGSGTSLSGGDEQI
jgi:hypothetical protein